MKTARFWLECAVLGVAVYAAASYVVPRWQGWDKPLALPETIETPGLEPGERPASSVSAPAPSRRARADVQQSMQVEREALPRPRKGKPIPRKDEVKLFDRPAIAGDSLALSKDLPPPPETRAWWQKLDPRLLIGFIVVLFVGAYALLVGALRKGPGTHGLTHD